MALANAVPKGATAKMAGGAAKLPKWQAISKGHLYQPILSADNNDSQPAR
jgi:hypothetical protein